MLMFRGGVLVRVYRKRVSDNFYTFKNFKPLIKINVLQT